MILGLWDTIQRRVSRSYPTVCRLTSHLELTRCESDAVKAGVSGRELAWEYSVGLFSPALIIMGLIWAAKDSPLWICFLIDIIEIVSMPMSDKPGWRMLLENINLKPRQLIKHHPMHKKKKIMNESVFSFWGSTFPNSVNRSVPLTCQSSTNSQTHLQNNHTRYIYAITLCIKQWILQDFHGCGLKEGNILQPLGKHDEYDIKI